MAYLAFDTATPWGRFALAEQGRLLVFRPLNIQGSFADALLPVIAEMLEEAGEDLADLEGLAVVRGPGSFTGVRIGVATAKGLAYALGCELAAVSSLEAMAAALLAEVPAARWAVPALDARRGEIFAGVFARAGHWVRPVVEPGPATPDRWWARLVQEVPDPEAPVYGGDGCPLLLGQGKGLRPQLAGSGEPRLRPWSAAHPATASALALAMADPAAGLPRIHPFALTPQYMRVSDAESKRRLDLTPAAPDLSEPPDRWGRSQP